MFYLLLSIIGLPTGLLVTRLSIDECRGKNKLLGWLMLPFALLLLLNLGLLVDTILLFIIAHLAGSIAYLRWRK